MIDMTDEEKSFMKSCDEFKEYGSIDEYVNDIRRLLMIGIMPPYLYIYSGSGSSGISSPKSSFSLCASISFAFWVGLPSGFIKPFL